MTATPGNDQPDSDATTGGNAHTGTTPDEDATTGLPTYVKILLALSVLVIVFIIVLDMLVIVGSL